MGDMENPSKINESKGSPVQPLELRQQENKSPRIPVVMAPIYDENAISNPFPLPTYTSSKPAQVGAESYDWVLCYSDDIYEHWRRIEQKWVMDGYTSMTTVRPIIINIVRDIQMNYGLENTTFHLAIHMLDYFLSRNSEDNINLKLLVVTALILAAKVEDVDMRVPRFTELNRTMLNNEFSLTDYRRIEMKLLSRLNFSLTIPTVATFSDLFSRISVILDDFHTYKRFFENVKLRRFNELVAVPVEENMYVIFETYDEMLSTVNQLLQCLVDYTLESELLLKVQSSLKAAACLAAARLMYHIQPVWTPYLEMQCCYTEYEIRPVMEVIISIYDFHVSNSSSSGSSSTSDTDHNDNDANNNIGGCPPNEVPIPTKEDS